MSSNVGLTDDTASPTQVAVPGRTRRWRGDGWINVRDLGGLPVRGGRRTDFGIVIRCGAGTLPAPPVATYLAVHRGPVNLLDLRENEEIRAPADDIGIHPNITVHRCGLGDPPEPRGRPDIRDPAYFAAIYEQMTPAALLAVGRILRLLAEDSAPVVVSCRLGKDRTGLVSMVLLALAGVPNGWIVRDFRLSARSFLAEDRWVAEYAAARNEAAAAVLRRCVLPPSVASRTLPGIRALLAVPDRWPDVLGVGPDIVSRGLARLIAAQGRV